jgi:hypothetical protein
VRVCTKVDSSPWILRHTRVGEALTPHLCWLVVDVAWGMRALCAAAHHLLARAGGRGVESHRVRAGRARHGRAAVGPGTTHRIS